MEDFQQRYTWKGDLLFNKRWHVLPGNRSFPSAFRICFERCMPCALAGQTGKKIMATLLPRKRHAPGLYSGARRLFTVASINTEDGAIVDAETVWAGAQPLGSAIAVGQHRWIAENLRSFRVSGTSQDRVG